MTNIAFILIFVSAKTPKIKKDSRDNLNNFRTFTKKKSLVLATPMSIWVQLLFSTY